MDNKLVDYVEIYLDSNNDFRWRARSNNGKIVADSGEGYANKFDIENVVANLFPDVEVRLV